MGRRKAEGFSMLWNTKDLNGLKAGDDEKTYKAKMEKVLIKYGNSCGKI